MRAMLFLVCLLLITASFSATVATAQPARVELSLTGGYVVSNGVNFASIPVMGEVYDTLEPADGGSFGAGIGYFATRNVEVAFLWDRQLSELVASGTTTTPISDMTIDNYHGLIIYNFGSPLDSMRPFFYGGLGATYYGSLKVPTAGGGTREVGGESKFSTVWAGGLKFYMNRNFGIQLHIKWTPTYIKSDPDGYWCDPYYGCTGYADADYSNQWQFGGALLGRF